MYFASGSNYNFLLVCMFACEISFTLFRRRFGGNSTGTQKGVAPACKLVLQLVVQVGVNQGAILSP